MDRVPWMVVTASVDAGVIDQFNVWHRDVHLPRVLAIPGIAGGRRLRNPPFAVNYAAIYWFESDDAVGRALSSSEAQAARSDWERWSENVRDLTVQLYTELTAARPLLRHN